MDKLKKSKILSKLFEVSIFVKGLEGIFEIIGGILLVYSVQTDKLTQFVLKMTEHELEQDPNNFLANKLVEIVQNIDPGISFGMAYLLIHGVIKVFLAILLLQRKVWAYPVAIYIWVTLVILLIFKFFEKWSPIYLVLAFFDLLIIVLTVIDYKMVKNKWICEIPKKTSSE